MELSRLRLREARRQQENIAALQANAYINCTLTDDHLVWPFTASLFISPLYLFLNNAELNGRITREPIFTIFLFLQLPTASFKGCEEWGQLFLLFKQRSFDPTPQAPRRADFKGCSKPQLIYLRLAYLFLFLHIIFVSTCNSRATTERDLAGL